MEASAWMAIVPPANVKIPTMISEEERKYLVWLTASQWSGDGVVCEIGSWLGGSTVCLAQGMIDSGRSNAKMLKVIDDFEWRDFMAVRAPLDIGVGESFEPAFRSFTRRYADVIDHYRMSLPDNSDLGGAVAGSSERREGDQKVRFSPCFNGAIEILFIDGAKSLSGMVSLLSEVRGRLLPGKSLLVCQDYKYWGAYWVLLVMQTLGDSVTPIHNVMSGTTLTFRLERALTDVNFADLNRMLIEPDLAGARRAISDVSDFLGRHGDQDGSCNVRLCAVRLLAENGRRSEAADAFNSIAEAWPWRTDPWQLVRAREYLRDEQGIPHMRTGFVLELVAIARRIMRRLRIAMTDGG